MLTTNAAGYLPVRLISSTTGLGVPSHVFATGEVQVNLNGAGWTNAGGACNEDGGSGNGGGDYTYAVQASEVSADGLFKLRVTVAGCLLYIIVDDVRAAVAAVDVSAIAAGVGNLVLDPQAESGSQTLAQAINLAADYACGDGDGLDGLAGSIRRRRPASAAQKDAIVFNVVAGKRRITKRDGT